MSSPIDANLHRLKNIYDNYREVRLSRDYYACRLVYYKRYNRLYEIVLALGASGSVAAGWYIWKTSYGQAVWGGFSGAAAILAILKPILKISEEVERYSKIHIAYADLTYDYKKLVDNIKVKGGIPEELVADVTSAEKRLKELSLADDPNPSEKLRRECQDKIKKVVPNFNDWLSG